MDSIGYERKRALVIGIDNYVSYPLEYCARDAQDFSSALESIGFVVTLETNINFKDFNQCLKSFVKGIRPKDVTLFYFAGHARLHEAANYLSISDSLILLEDIFQQFRSGNCCATIFMLDCSRKNMKTSQENIRQNLVPIKALPNTIIAFTHCSGAVPRKESSDGKNGHFMQSLLFSIKKPNTDILEVLQYVKTDIYHLTSALRSLSMKSGLQGPLCLVKTDYQAQDKRPPNEPSSIVSPRDSHVHVPKKHKERDPLMQSSDNIRNPPDARGGSNPVRASRDPERELGPGSNPERFSKVAIQNDAMALKSPRERFQHQGTPSDSFDARSNPIESRNPGQYLSELFGVSGSTDSKVKTLLENLRYGLPPMNKRGSMSGKCIAETDQMEDFLRSNFEFRNIKDQCIVSGVRAFVLERPVRKINPNTIIHFPCEASYAFRTTIDEIIKWQNSYIVYADRSIPGMDKPFLQKALQGQSQDGEEAFRMKFVVRISDCPVVMNFDSKILKRSLTDAWPNCIKLVSVTGIDFAGRKHDVNDITTYVTNWKEVFEIDRTTGKPRVFGGRDFHPIRHHPPAQLDEDRLYRDLIRMVGLRLYACDREGVKIVIETGIGLGVFSGKHFGIDARVRMLSARAIRHVLQNQSSNYQNILAVVLALPIFSPVASDGHRPLDTYDYFVDEFRQSRYRGPIPVLVVDHDLHELTLATAFRGFRVSQLNPADSHGVFGEYWQNHGPAVEEKLALTTLGLLVQHHLINPNVLDVNRYKLI